jgi:hypothetical protein
MGSQSENITLHDLEQFFTKHAGPAFCIAAPGALHTYPLLKDSVGLVHPVRRDKYAGVRVDWTISKNWHKIKMAYQDIAKHPFLIEELSILGPLTDDIPQMVDELSDWDWQVTSQDQEVVIHPARMNSYGAWAKVSPYVGIVSTFGHHKDDELSVVSFATSENHRKMLNVETSSLIRVPPSFKQYLYDTEKPTNVANTVHKSYKKPKYIKGDVVKGTSSMKDDDFTGLIGIVEKVFQVQPTANFHYNVSFEYEINFDTVPNRSLSLCEGENEAYLSVRRCTEYEIEEHNQQLTEKPHLMTYKSILDREKVWIMPRQCVGEINIKSNPKDKTVAEGLLLEAKTEKSNGKFNVACRDIDYLYDKEKLYVELATCSSVGLAIEPDERDPNNKESRCYIYGYKEDCKVHLRILLGCLRRNKNAKARLGKALTEGRIEHPWQLHRYLRKRRLGHFYEIIQAKEYLNLCQNFISWADETEIENLPK